MIADFGNGRHLTFLVSTQLINTQSIEIVGTKGRVEIIIPFNAPQDKHTAIFVDKGESSGRTSGPARNHAAIDQYTEQAEAFALAVLGKQPLLWGVEDAIRSMRVLDAVFESETRRRLGPGRHGVGHRITRPMAEPTRWTDSPLRACRCR